jgi:hypothetical protein
MFSNKNQHILLVNTHRFIEENAVATITHLAAQKADKALFYPPNCSLNEAENAAITSIDWQNDALQSAFRKILANNSAGVLFDLFNIIDGTTEPDEDWSGVHIVDATSENADENQNDFLHDEFLATYWDWRAKRSEKNWKLDAYEGEIL